MQEQQPLNIVIPMAGHGTRFATVGYPQPKPLICILGRPMVVHLLSNLHLDPNDTIYIGLRHSSNEAYDIMSKLRAHLPNLKMREVLIEGTTRGAADTLNRILEHIPRELQRRRVVSLDCDTIYYFDVLAPFRRFSQQVGGVVFFTDYGNKPIFSYICLDDEKRITRIKEKEPISKYASTGAYGFADAAVLQSSLANMLNEQPLKREEFYISSVIEKMIDNGFGFFGIEAGEFACVGTPKQMISFIEVSKRNRRFETSAPLVFSVNHLSGISDDTTNGHSQLCTLPDDCFQVLRDLKDVGFRVLVAAENGVHHCVNGENFEVASVSEIEHAKELGCLFIVDSNIRKLVGW